MSITSLSFVLFVFAAIVVYYLLPKRFQWIVLLVFSGIFYISFGIKSAIYVWITATTVYLATVWMQWITSVQKSYLKDNKQTLSKEEKKIYKDKCKIKRKCIMLCTLFLNIGILAVFKYFHFALEQFNSILLVLGGQKIDDIYHFIVPLGISFYTFQSIGYLIDVYFEYYEPEKNYFKVLLFVSFFPQMTQGPISDFEQLSKELFAEHELSYKNYSWGLQRVIWGFMKKMIIADTLAPFVQDVFTKYELYSGITTLTGAFLYSIQIYTDFSGYMDIMCGLCEIMGIHLTENFERPYFSKSIAEYWRRWHISLGAWFKKYIYYTIGMSSWSRRLAASTKEKFGKHLGNTIPATIALIVVWSATGLWHGANWAYIIWGLVNGLFIILSLWMEPVYASCRCKLGINDGRMGWKVFQVIRTFFLVTMIKVLPEVGTLSDGIGLWKQVFTNHELPHSLTDWMPYVEWTDATTVLRVLLALLGTGAVFVVSLLQRKRSFRELFNVVPFTLRVVILSIMVVVIASFGVQSTWGAGGFLYANF